MARLAYIELDHGLIIETDTPEHWTEGKRLPQKEGKERHRANAIEQLRKILKPGDTVFTVIRSVSRSGMSRRIDAYAIADNDLRYLSGYIATALDWPHPNHDGGIKVDGCGMDMGFHLVYTVSRILFRDAVEQKDAGYVLKQRWI